MARRVLPELDLEKERDPLLDTGGQFSTPVESKPKFSAAVRRIFDILKLIIGLCLLPFVYSFTVSFLKELHTIDPAAQKAWWSGIIALLIFYFFIWEPTVIYARGQKVVEFVFAFFKPMVKVAPYVLPIYSLLLFGIYLIVNALTHEYRDYFMFIFSATLALHLIIGAKTLRGKKGDLLKSHYIFGFSFVYLITIILVALCLNALFADYGFARFFNSAFRIASGLLSVVFKQLFVPQ